MKRAATKYVVWHCSATRPDVHVDAATIRQWHTDPPPKGRGWADIGYALVILRDGTIEAGRPLDEIGAHVAGHNHDSIGICMVGGLDSFGNSHANRPDLFTFAQWETARAVYQFMRRLYPFAQHVGHRDLSPDRDSDGQVEPQEWLKHCPCFDVTRELIHL